MRVLVAKVSTLNCLSSSACKDGCCPRVSRGHCESSSGRSSTSGRAFCSNSPEGAVKESFVLRAKWEQRVIDVAVLAFRVAFDHLFFWSTTCSSKVGWTTAYVHCLLGGDLQQNGQNQKCQGGRAIAHYNMIGVWAILTLTAHDCATKNCGAMVQGCPRPCSKNAMQAFPCPVPSGTYIILHLLSSTASICRLSSKFC